MYTRMSHLTKTTTYFYTALSHLTDQSLYTPPVSFNQSTYLYTPLSHLTHLGGNESFHDHWRGVVGRVDAHSQRTAAKLGLNHPGGEGGVREGMREG